MQRFIICFKIFLFLHFEPLHSYDSEPMFMNSLNNPKFSTIASNNGGSRDSEHYTASNANQQRAYNAIIRSIFANVTGLPKATPLHNSSPRSIPLPISTRSSPSAWRSTENVTTNYYSTHAENYPDYEKVAEKLKKFQGFLVKDVLPNPELTTHDLIDADKEQYRHLCASKKVVDRPRKILNENKEFVKIANFDERFEQSIEFETCWETDINCTYSEFFPNHLRPVCKQNYVFRTIVILDNNDNPSYGPIPIPAGCVCVVKDMSLE